MRSCCRWTVFIIVGLFFMNLAVVDSQYQSQVRSKVGNNCKGDGECPDNAFCRLRDGGGFCVCKETFLLHLFNITHMECLKEANRIGDDCQQNIQCQAKLSTHSECRDGQCQCKDGTHFDSDRCYVTAIIGQRCGLTQNCYLGPGDQVGDQAYCVRGYCQCSMLHSPRDGGIRCLKDAILGDLCEDDEHCAGDNIHCHEVCRCNEGHVVHPEEQRCLKGAAMGEACEIEAQCTAMTNNTACFDQQCACSWEYHLQDGRCWQNRYIGQRCSSNQECLTESGDRAQCVRGSCTCIGCEPYAGGVGSSASFSTANLITTLLFTVTTISVATNIQRS